MKSKKGQYPFFLFMIGVIIFLVAFQFAGPLVKSSAQVMSGMDCGNSSISTGQKISCTTVDIVAPFIIALLLGLGGVAFTAKLMGG
jgi:hypothetical protein